MALDVLSCVFWAQNLSLNSLLQHSEDGHALNTPCDYHIFAMACCGLDAVLVLPTRAPVGLPLPMPEMGVNAHMRSACPNGIYSGGPEHDCHGPVGGPTLASSKLVWLAAHHVASGLGHESCGCEVVVRAQMSYNPAVAVQSEASSVGTYKIAGTAACVQGLFNASMLGCHMPSQAWA